jgi:hypothetical protein
LEVISAIIGRNPQAAVKILRPAEKAETVKPSRVPESLKAYYRNGEIEIIYINNVADWITVNNGKGATTISDFIKTLKLDETKKKPALGTLHLLISTTNCN